MSRVVPRGLPAPGCSRIGIGLALLAYALLATQDASIKLLVATVPVVQILFVRSLIIALGCLGYGGASLIRHAATTPAAPILVRRGLVTLVAWLCYFTAAQELALAQLVALYFSAPVIAILLAAPLLKERVTWSRGASVCLGFVGTIALTKSVDFPVSVATLLVMAAAALWAYAIILTKQIAQRETSLLQMFYNNCFFMVITGAASVLTWHTPKGVETWLLLAAGILGGLGQLGLFESARRAPASVIASLQYTTLLWAFALGIAVWGDVPDRFTLAGAGLILASGMVTLIAERRDSRAFRPGATTTEGMAGNRPRPLRSAPTALTSTKLDHQGTRTWD